LQQFAQVLVEICVSQQEEEEDEEEEEENLKLGSDVCAYGFRRRCPILIRKRNRKW